MNMQDREIKELERALERIWEIARCFGLDPFPTRFEIVPAAVMYEIGSYALPGRYSHWTFGKAYHRMKTMYDFGLSKIYEVVINTNRPTAFCSKLTAPSRTSSSWRTSSATWTSSNITPTSRRPTAEWSRPSRRTRAA